MGIDIWEVVDAASTKPYGFMRFEPGPGMGGHCLPVDPFYLTWRAREFHMSTEFIELAGKVNQYMPYHCAERVEQALNDVAKPVKGSRILILGASYKGGVGDIRESPALRIIEVLAGRGGIVSYHDEYVPSLPMLGLESVPLDDAVSRGRRGRAGHRASRGGPRGGRRPQRAVRGSARRHPRPAGREPRSSVATSAPGRQTWLILAALAPNGPAPLASNSRRCVESHPDRARSSVGERSLHTREAAGSNPAVPIKNVQNAPAWTP